MKNRNESSKTAVNILCSVLEMGVGLLVSFFLSPYIIRTIGVEANGFVGLAQNFTTYAGLVVTALNGMAGRYITIAHVRRDMKQANLYYNSVFWGNLIIVAVLLIPSVVLVTNLEQFINTPAHLVADVKILFALVFLAFFLQTGAPNWDCGASVTNRLDRVYIPNTITALLRPVLLLSLFGLFEPRVWYISAVGLVLKLIYLAVGAYNTHTLTPDLKIHFRKPLCSLRAIWDLVGSGIWNSFACAGNMLFSGLDLLICNLHLGPTAMGILALSKTIPNIHHQFVETIRGAFGPELTIAYARGDRDSIVRLLRRDIKICAVVVSMITGGIIVLCDKFYGLWVPDQDAGLLHVLTVLAMLRYITDSGVYILENVFPTTNKVRYNACGLIICGIVSISITLILVNRLDHDIYVIASVSSVVAIARSMLFMIPATSHFIGLKWHTFYPQVLQSILSCAVMVGIGYLVRSVLPINGWIMFFIAAGITALLGTAANMMIVLNAEDRRHLIGMVRSRLRRS